MRGNVIRASAFAGITFLLLVVADVFMWGGYQGGHPEAQRSDLLGTHAAFHAGVLGLSMLGAFIGFVPVRRRFLPMNRIVVLAAVFAIATFFAVVAAFQAGGVFVAALWLLVGSSIVAFVGGRILSSPQTHG